MRHHLPLWATRVQYPIIVPETSCLQWFQDFWEEQNYETFYETMISKYILPSSLL